MARIYTKRVRKFNLQTANAIVKSVKEIGVVATAKAFNTLPIYVSDLCKKRKVKVQRGRRPAAKAA